jgi:hypothetical protein
MRPQDMRCRNASRKSTPGLQTVMHYSDCGLSHEVKRTRNATGCAAGSTKTCERSHQRTTPRPPAASARQALRLRARTVRMSAENAKELPRTGGCRQRGRQVRSSRRERGRASPSHLRAPARGRAEAATPARACAGERRWRCASPGTRQRAHTARRSPIQLLCAGAASSSPACASEHVSPPPAARRSSGCRSGTTRFSR